MDWRLGSDAGREERRGQLEQLRDWRLGSDAGREERRGQLRQSREVASLASSALDGSHRMHM